MPLLSLLVIGQTQRERRGSLLFLPENCNSCQELSLTLLVAGLRAANHADTAITTNDLAVCTDLLNGSLDFHKAPIVSKTINSTGLVSPTPTLRTTYRIKPEEPYPLRFAFFISDSYCCDIMCDCTCDMKSMTTTTTMRSDVPPKWKGTLNAT